MFNRTQTLDLTQNRLMQGRVAGTVDTRYRDCLPCAAPASERSDSVGRGREAQFKYAPGQRDNKKQVKHIMESNIAVGKKT